MPHQLQFRQYGYVARAQIGITTMSVYAMYIHLICLNGIEFTFIYAVNMIIIIRTK